MVTASQPPIYFTRHQKHAAVIFVLVVVCFAFSDGESLVHLQTDGKPNNDSGLTFKQSLPELKSFTLCLRMYSYRSRYSDYFFSYATNDSDNELAFHLKYRKKEFRVACCTKRVFQIFHVDISPLKWFYFCCAVDLSSLTVTLVHSGGIDHQPVSDSQKKSLAPLVVRSGGTIILGQDQDEPGGGTDEGQSFNGLLADVFFTQEVIQQQDMLDYVNCNNNLILRYSSLLDFSNIPRDFSVGLKTIEKREMAYCPADNKFYVIFPEARNFYEANDFCSIMNGKMALPDGQDDDEALYLESIMSADKCTVFDKGNGMWVAVTWDHTLNIWKNMHTMKKTTYNNFEVEISPVSDDVLCVISQTEFETAENHQNGNWDIESCERDICTACQFEEPKPLKIRGLCAESIFDRQYFVYGRINGRPVFNGMSWTKIVWNNTYSAYDYTWIMHQIAEPHVQAKMVTESELEYPIGVHDFQVIGDKCPLKQIRLKLTSCPNGMYTCNDGSCIYIGKRCNLELDCKDHSDEFNCGTLILPDGYEKRLPPPKKDSATPATISIDLVIRLIRDFNLLESQLVIDFLITRTWYDSRVKYKNLHDTKNLNLIDNIVDMLWYPDVTFLGADNSIAKYEILITQGWGQRSVEPLPDNDQLLDEDVYYSGTDNPVVLQREFTVNIKCNFDLSLYPFDSQLCSLIFYVGDYTQYYVSTELDQVTFSGSKRLLEYKVTSVQQEALLYQNKSGQQIHIVLTNLYGYYIIGAYIPTLLLIVISYSTFYFSLGDFTNRIMVSLTSLLVLASLFSQIASGLPKTAYMKLIDVWFIFCIMSDFVMVMILVAINTILSRRESSASQVKVINVKVSSSTKASVDLKGQFPLRLHEEHVARDMVPVTSGRRGVNPQTINKVAQILLPLFMLAFVVGYLASVISHLTKIEYMF